MSEPEFRGPPRVKPARDDWRDLSEAEQLQVALVQQDLALVAICSVRVQTYLRRHMSGVE